MKYIIIIDHNISIHNYRKDNDMIRQFVEQQIIEDEKSVMSLIEVFTLYKEWLHISYPHTRVCNKNDFGNHLAKMWGPLSRSYRWKGYRTRTEMDDRKDDVIFQDTNEELNEVDEEEEEEELDLDNEEDEDNNLELEFESWSGGKKKA